MKIERKSMKLGDILVAHQIASQEDIESAIAEQKASGGKLGDILVRRGIASREDIFWALSNQFNISYMPVDKNQIDPQIVRIIPEEMARKNNILPLLKVANDLVLVVDDPMQFSVFEDVERLTGLEVNLCLGKSEEITEALDYVYGKKAEKGAEEAIEVLDARFAREEIENIGEPRAEKLLKKLFSEMMKAGGGTLHIDKTRHFAFVRCRLDGFLQAWLKLPVDWGAEIATRVRISAGLGAGSEAYQEGMLALEYEGKSIKCSVLIVAWGSGESIIVKPVAERKKFPELKEVGFATSQLKELSRIASLKRGLVICTGPKNSGKTTTLYACLKGSENSKMVILGGDDTHAGGEISLLVPSGEQLVSTFDLALKTDPDAILIEPTPTLKAIEKAVYESLESVKVGIQLPMPDALSVVSYLLEIGIPASAVASAISIIIAQRLLRKLCEHCKKPAGVPSGLKLKGAQVFEPVGCEKCANTGYSGRVAIFELLIPDSQLRSVIASKPDADELYEILGRMKISVLKERALELFSDGVTSAEEIAEFM